MSIIPLVRRDSNVHREKDFPSEGEVYCSEKTSRRQTLCDLLYTEGNRLKSLQSTCRERQGEPARGGTCDLNQVRFNVQGSWRDIQPCHTERDGGPKFLASSRYIVDLAQWCEPKRCEPIAKRCYIGPLQGAGDAPSTSAVVTRFAF